MQYPKPELVYLLHGFAAGPRMMNRLARRIQSHGYDVRNWGYPSLRHSIARHACELLSHVHSPQGASSYERVHFVTHSLGSIVVRQALHHLPSDKIGHVVMLAPPNRGSLCARLGEPLLGRFCPVLRELSTRATSYVNSLDMPAHVPVGIIVASSDWVVLRRHAFLASQRDYVIVRGEHIFLPLLRTTATQTIQFLASGRFARFGYDGRLS